MKLILRPEITEIVFLEGYFSTNSTKTIRLFALDFYDAIVDEAEPQKSRAQNLIVRVIENARKSTWVTKSPRESTRVDDSD